MKTIWQEDGLGCAAACVAMLADMTYDDAKQLVFGVKKPNYVKTSAVVALIEALGFQVVGTGRLSQARPVTNLRHNALIKGSVIERGNSYGHFLVWDANGQVLRDPYRYKVPFHLTSYTEFRRRP